MSHEVEHMLYREEVPWHGLGISISPVWDSDRIFAEAKVDWTVSKRRLSFDSARGPAFSPIVPKGVFVVARDTDDEYYGVCSKHYQPIQNRENIQFVIDLCNAGDAKIETIGSLRRGAHVWVLARLSDLYLSNKEKIEQFLLIAIPHTPGKAVIYKYTNVRVVCANTIAIALESGSSQEVRIQHSSQYKNHLAAAKQLFASARDVSEKFQLSAESLMKQEITDQEAATFLAKFFAKDQLADLEPMLKAPVPLVMIEASNNNETTPSLRKAVNSYLHAPGAQPGTKWGLLNGITHYLDHVVRSTNTETRVGSIWFGDSNQLKERAMKELLAA